MVFYSHLEPKQKRIVEHISEVIQISKCQVGKNHEIVAQKREEVDEKNEIADKIIGKVKIIKIAEILAICHDFGKYTTYFQKYLKSKKRSSLTNHGFLSAVFGTYTTFAILGEDNILPLIVYSIILHHHGNIENISNDLPGKIVDFQSSYSVALYSKIDASKKQIEDIKANREYIEKDFNSIDSVTNSGSLVSYSKIFNEFLDVCDIEQVLLKLKILEVKASRQPKNQYYFLHNILYSALISADKLSASNTIILEEKYATFNALDEIRMANFKGQSSEMAKIRQNVYSTVVNNIEKRWKDSDIFSVTSPTGTGKTFAGYFAALKLSEMLGGRRRIIYALPFTSIINQNYDSIRKLYNSYSGFEEESSRFLIKHHRLADVLYSTSEVDYEKDQAELLLNNWISGIVVTTFVQLLETLISNKNRMLMKLNNIKNSIIILDEVQAIDIEYYKLVGYILKLAVEELNTKIIMMTATKPLILTDALELLDDVPGYFKMFNRTRLILMMKKLTPEEFVDEFELKIKEKSCLIVCNTINQSLKIFELIKKTGIEAEYLSSNILPVHRRKRIYDIEKKLKAGKKVVLVSTQVIEAGVDLDFEMVIRDIGPLDSIIQCAGRCNRNGLKHIGDVFVVQMVNEDNKLYSYAVYGNTSINITIELLERFKVIEEKEFYDLINEYFTMVQANKSHDDSIKIIESLETLNFDGDYGIPISKFSLIKNNPGYIDVIFRVDEYIEGAYQQFLQALLIKNLREKHNMILEVKNIIKDYTISLPVKYYKKFAREYQNENIISLPYSDCIDIYNEVTGFQRQEEDYYMF